MTYPYPELLPLLQIQCAPSEYRRLTADTTLTRLQTNPQLYEAYWRIIPRYTYAYCPICQIRYQAPADTYSVTGWLPHRHFFHALYVTQAGPLRQHSCPHLLGIQLFVNFHSNLPTELTWFENQSGEVPYLTPWFFPPDIPGYAILHALPICRIEDEQFVPRYTVFILTYFSQSPHIVLERHYAAEWARGQGDSEFYPATVAAPGPYGYRLLRRWRDTAAGAQYNLSTWAAKGRLGWLDVTPPELPLQMGPAVELPALYRSISGAQHEQLWRRGRMEKHS